MENYEKINNSEKFDYNFVFEDKYIYVKKNDQNFKIISPYLKVLK